MNKISLRPYQEKFIADIRNEFKNNQRRVVGVAPCGAGKTIMTGWIIRQTIKNGKRAIFFVHRKELIDQTSDTFSRLGIPHGIIAAGVQPNFNAPVQIASIQTLVNHLRQLNPPDLLVCDECHHILASTYQTVIHNWRDSFLLGVTATPERMGGVRLGDVFSSMVQAPTVSELIQLGNLTHFNYFVMDIDLQLENIQIRRGDYVSKDLSKLMINPIITDSIVKSYMKYALGKSAICYCVNVEHSQHVAEFFNNAGIPTAHCDGSTPKKERNAIIDDFRNGKFKILCNAELFGEGFDVPNCHAVILARPTKSLTLHIQQSMRSMRPDPSDPNKIAVIIDCVKNYVKLGKPDDPRDWSLDPNKPRGEGVVPYKICPQCHNLVNMFAEFCPCCNYKFTADVHVIGADTAEKIYSSVENKETTSVNADIIHAPKSIEDFIEVADARGYQKTWAMFQALKHAANYNDLIHIAEVMGYQKGWAYYKALERNFEVPRRQKKGC